MDNLLLLDEIHILLTVPPTLADDAVAAIRTSIMRRAFLKRLQRVIRQFIAGETSSRQLRVQLSR